jgi:ubiquinone/menaquinone biosynthesis C-methylase UbiE
MAHQRGGGRFRHDDEARKQWQDPETILSDIGLGPGMAFADIGAGEGYFAIPAARKVGPSGKVYALDINADSIAQLLKTADAEGLGNVVARSGPGETTVLCESCADIVFFGIDLHDFADAQVVLQNARKTIKPDGKLVNLDWKKESMELGPPVEIRFNEATAVYLITEAGFVVESVTDHGPYHYMVIASPSSP